MLFRYLFLWSVLVSSGLFLHAQDTIRFTDGTEVLAEIRPLSSTRNFDLIRYTTTKESGVQEATANRVAYFSFAGNDKPYESVEIDRKLPEVEGGPPSKLRRFGQRILDGPIRLYRVPLNAEDYDQSASGAENYLYILKKDDESYQLDVLTTLTTSGATPTVSTRYRNVLAYVLRDCEKAKRLTRNLRFNDLDMQNAIADYYGCIGTVGAAVQRREATKPTLWHGVGVGYFTASGGGVQDNSSGFLLDYQGEFRFAGATSFLGVPFGAGLGFHQYELAARGVREEGNQTSLLAMVGVNVHPLPADGPVDVFLGVGAMINLVVSSSFSDLPDAGESYNMSAIGGGVTVDRFSVRVVRGLLPPTQTVFKPERLLRFTLHYRLSK